MEVISTETAAYEWVDASKTESSTEEAVNSTTVIAAESSETKHLFEDLLEDRSAKNWFGVARKEMKTSVDSVMASNSVLLCNPRSYNDITVYLIVFYFDENENCVFKACAMDHIGKSDVFLGTTYHENEILFHVSDGLQNVDIEYWMMMKTAQFKSIFLTVPRNL
jgi:hypothetical protein